MKHKIIIFILFSGLLSIPVKGMSPPDSLKTGFINFKSTYPDRWLSEDKYKHLTTSMFLCITSFYYSAYLLELNQKQSAGISAAVSFNIGFLKEIYDGRYKKNGYFSYKDLIADGLGVSLGIIIVSTVSR